MPPDQIQFQSENMGYARPAARPLSFITGLVIRLGLAKDERGAQVAMLIVVVVAIVLAFIIPRLIGGGSSGPQVPQEQIDRALQSTPTRR